MRQRAKPLLGTLVEIRADCDNEAAFIAATDAAFARIENVHRAMSFHESSGDLQVIARCRTGEALTVAHDTWHVLQLALQMEHDSEGVFNATIAPALVGRGMLPRPAGASNTPVQSTLADSIRLDDPCVVQVLQPVWIDLGGIAKGYAVDAATTALGDFGVRRCVVNAGGDLRVFGDVEQQISVRHPRYPGIQLPVATVANSSCATSGDYFVAAYPMRAPNAPSAIVGLRAPCATPIASVTVFAPRCVIADALTKIVWIKGIADDSCLALLQKYDASAVTLDIHGNAAYAKRT